MTAASASVEARRIAMQTRDATKLFQLWVTAVQTSVAKNNVKVKTKTGLLPKYAAVGNQRKFYESADKQRVIYSQAQSENRPIDNAINSCV